MQIQFSRKAAEDACAQLEEQANEIQKKRMVIENTNKEMKHIWTGDLSDHVIGQMEAYTSWLEDVKAYVDYIESHIAVCRRNYELTERTNTRILKDIDSMFL